MRNPPDSDALASPAALLRSLQHAIGLHTAGAVDQAAQLYREVLAQDPLHPVALHFLGIVLHQQGQHTQALAYVRQSCALQPDNAGWYNDLGNMLFAQGEFAQASDAYASSLALEPDDHMVWNNLGAAQMQLPQQRSEAIAAFERVLALQPDFVPALTHLGSIYEALGDKLRSADYQCRAFVQPPLEGKAKEMLGIAFYFLGRLPEAAEVYRDWLTEEPDNPIAAHMYAACAQVAVPQRASDSYIEQHFDRYAENFNTHLLESLAYRGPELMRQGLAQVATPQRQYDMLDIGCGTGLCAPVAAPYARSLTGVDLSGKMLEQARLRGGYDHLVKQEITAYLSARPAAFDLLIAADTMMYFGQLDAVFQAAAQAMRPAAYFIFTLEVAQADEAAADFYLHASGRYRHTAAYVQRVLEGAGLVISNLQETVLREELQQPVAGMLLTVQRPR